MALTARSRKFAQLVASGLFQSEALDIAYGKGTRTRKTRKETASRLAAKPEIKAAILEYEEELMPMADLRVVQQQMLANMRDLALRSPDHRVRLEASRLLHGICEKREEQERSQLTVNIDVLLREIAQLAPQRTVEFETAGAETDGPAAAEV
jgi:hypothetical protein